MGVTSDGSKLLCHGINSFLNEGRVVPRKKSVFKQCIVNKEVLFTCLPLADRLFIRTG